jgi:ABC-2 type transport system ATP-binding protein
VAALCPRVVVIDKGQLSYDGGLDALVQRIRPEKRLVLQLESAVDEAALTPLGKVVQLEPGRVVLQVDQTQVNTTVARALASLPIRDLTVENAPLEEVMSELFSRSRAAQQAEAARAAETASAEAHP